MNKKRITFKLLFLFCYFFFPNLKAGYNFDGLYKSYFIMKMNSIVYQGNYKCPREVPITIELTVIGDQVTGFIENNHEKCDSWQNASITGSIDKEGNFLKTKFIHKDKLYGRREDAYKIEGNILKEMTLKSKSRMYWKDQKFSFSDKKFTENNFEVIDKNKINDPKNENINFSETKKNQTEKEKELKKLNQLKIKEQKEIKKDSNLLFN